MIYLARACNVNNDLRITLYDLCQQMRLSYNQERSKKLEERALKLQLGQVKIQTNNKALAGSLINTYTLTKKVTVR